MSKLVALSVSIALLGGIWAYLALGPLAGMVLVWAGFIAWGCYFHTGGDNAALQKTIAGMIYGAVIAGIALWLVGSNPVGLPAGAVAAAVYIGVTVFFLVIVAGFNLLSVVPANVYGYAATAGYALESKNMAVTAMNMTNPVLIVALSIVIGAVFGMLSGKLSGMLSK